MLRLHSSKCHFLGKSKMFLNDFQINKNLVIIKKWLHFSDLLAMKQELSISIQVEILSISFSRKVGGPQASAHVVAASFEIA